MDAILKPVRTAVSKPAQRAYLQTFLFAVTALFLLFSAIVAYLLFYLNYIPRISVERPVFLQFSANSNPNATVDLDSDVIAKQPYDVLLVLRVPASPDNFSRGNFMLDIEVYDSLVPPPSSLEDDRKDHLLLHARRPAIMTYSSPLLVMLETLFYFPLHVLGLLRHEERLETVLATGAMFAVPPKSAIITVDHGIAIYDAALKFDARFGGLRWIMYHYRLTAFVVLTLVFWSTELFWAGFVWWIVSAKLMKQSEDGYAADGAESDEETDSNAAPFVHGDPQRAFPRTTGAPPLRPSYPSPEATPEPGGLPAPAVHESADADDEDEEAIPVDGATDSGLGSSLSESTGRARSEGAQRRKSHGRASDK